MVLALARSRSVTFLWTLNPNFLEETSKSTFHVVHPKIVLSVFDEDFSQVICMLTLSVGLYNDLIYIIVQVIVEHIVKDVSYGTLVGGISIF